LKPVEGLVAVSSFMNRKVIIAYARKIMSAFTLLVNIREDKLPSLDASHPPLLCYGTAAASVNDLTINYPREQTIYFAATVG
jgi:hypothetical protein